MICTWCKDTATEGGRIPEGVRGPEYLKACERHTYLIKALKYDPVPIDQLRKLEKAENVNR
jgi:hypothetical protein